MGALTLKNFPFELRGWDLEKFEFLDPTDGFGSNTKIYINKYKIIQVEPDYNSHNLNKWLTDKGRQFFDSLIINEKNSFKKKSWLEVLNKIIATIYIFDHCSNKNNKNYFFTIVFNHLSIEILSILIFISQSCSLITLKKAESYKINTDIESNFQLNNVAQKLKLNLSVLCLLLSTNPKYEGYYLNLNLRQRILKGNFKCLVIGSLINLTFPTSFLGSNLKIIKTLVEGNNFLCQDLQFANNPILIYNSELFKQNHNKNTNDTLKLLCFSNIFNKTWNGLNILNPTLCDTGSLNLKQIPKLMKKNLKNFSALYFINTSTHNVSNLKKITELKLLLKSPKINKKLFLDQNSKINNNLTFSNQILSDYLYIPSNTIFENEETFLSTDGFFKRTNKIISLKNHKSNWQILRKIFKHFKNKITFLNQKDNQIIFFNLKKFYNFKNFIGFQFYATQSLTNLNFYLNIKNKSIILNKNFLNFKPETKKFVDTKLKYWSDDFFISNKDEYSQYSIILANSSKILRTEHTNFF